jgi:hypothetical protein
VTREKIMAVAKASCATGEASTTCPSRHGGIGVRAIVAADKMGDRYEENNQLAGNLVVEMCEGMDGRIRKTRLRTEA